ncbi:MAG TPA: AI-2E family transporter [Vicinamibacterales bacterium]|nr:AI-2E family transporter [Vicinamibacterales bacterium]
MTTRPRDTPRALIRYALAAAAFTVALAWTLYVVRNTLLLIYVAALIAVGLSPLVNAIERQRRIRPPRWAAILTVYLVFLTIVITIGILIVPPLVSQASDLWTAAPDLLHRAQQWLIQRRLLSREISMLEAVQRAPVGGSDAVGTVLAALSGLVGGLFGLLTILIVAFYLLVDSAGIVRTMVRLFPRPDRARVDQAFHRAAEKVSAWLAGQLLLGAIIGTTAAIALGLMGVPYFYVLALVSGVGEMIPVVGPVLAAIPAIAVAFSVSPATALGVTVFFVVQQQVENHVLVPKVMSRQVGVSPVVVIIALLIGGSLLGIVGAILAVPTAAILQVLLQELFAEASAD